MLWGCLSPFIILTLSVGTLYFVFTPFIEINEKDDTVAFFNSMIVINGKSGAIKVQDSYISIGSSPHTFSGEDNLDRLHIQTVSLDFSNADIKFVTSPDRTIKWNCKIGLETSDPLIKPLNGVMKFDLALSPDSQCDFEIPKDIELVIRTNATRAKFDLPEYNIDFNFNMGDVSIIPSKQVEYFYDLTVFGKGSVDQFLSSQASNPYNIQIKGNRGNIRSY